MQVVRLLVRQLCIKVLRRYDRFSSDETLTKNLLVSCLRFRDIK